MDVNSYLSKHERTSTLVWCIKNIQLPKSQKWSFEDRPWQIQILDDPAKEICARKPTQIGMSTVFLNKMLHFADTHTCRLMMTLPRQDDVFDMVNSRLSEIIQESPYVRERMGGIDNVRMKKFGKSWLHFVEMSVPPRMMDVDWLLNDEVDLSPQEHLEQVISRLDASEYAYHHRISTPTIDDFGIDAIYKLSDMKVWLVTCPYCSHEQQLDWNLNVAHTNGKTWYMCSRCMNPLGAEDIREGRWVATGNKNSDISGYQINQMMTPYISPNRLYNQYHTMTRKNFYNFRLGLPYLSTSGGFTRELLLQNCTSTNHNKETAAGVGYKYVLGCDQGNILHVSVGRVSDDGNIEIVYLAEVSFDDGFKELEKIIKRYNIRRGVIDALPNNHVSQRLVADYQGRLFAAYFSQIDALYRTDVLHNKILINKTDAYDRVMESVLDSSMQFYGSSEVVDGPVNKAIAHLCNMRRDVEEQKTKIGGVKTFHVWRNTGPDHYADAILYMIIASDLLKGSTKSLEVVNLDNLDNNDEEEQDYLDTGLGDLVDSAGNLVGNNKKKREATLSGSESMKRLSNPGLAPDNPYKTSQLLVLGKLSEFIHKEKWHGE